MDHFRTLARKALSLVYPPTKAKLHRLFHWLATAAAIGGSVCVWILGQKWGWSTWNQVEAQALLASTYLARAGALFKRLDGLVDQLPIPDDSGSFRPVISADNKLVGCEIVGWDGKGDDKRRTDKGGAKLAALYLLALAAIMVWAAINVVDMGKARADQFGGCTADRSVCAGPAVAVTLGQLNLSTGKFGGGISPGLGFGVTLQPDRWYATGLAFYAAFSVGGGKPNSLDPSLMLSFANYVRLGFAVPFSEREGGGLGHEFVLRFGLGADMGKEPAKP